MNKSNFKIITGYSTINEAIKFGFVGVLNTIIGYGAYYILVRLNIYYILASVISQAVAMTHSYIWNKFFTFNSRKKSLMELTKFTCVALLTYLINLFLLMVFVEKYFMDKTLAGFLSMMIVTILSFLGHKFISFSK